MVVTGLGAITPVGLTVDSYWQSLCAGKSGVTKIEHIDTTGIDCKIGAMVKDFRAEDYLERKDARRIDRFVQMAIAASQEAIRQSGLQLDDEDKDRIGTILGVGFGGLETLSDQFAVLFQKGPRRISPFFIPMLIGNMAAGQISMLYGLRGPNYTTVTACASSGHGIGEAMRTIQYGDADVIVTGGTEAPFSEIGLAGFCAMKALSTRNDEPEKASRPFDKDRDGFVMGEGAGILVLESLEHAQRRGARILAELVGYGTSADAYHITQPAPQGAGGAQAMRRALADAGLRPEDVDYINAHGTSTPAGDREETNAIKSVFGEAAYKIPTSSTKSMTGHPLGAGAALELIACIKAIEDGIVPPTINLDEPGEGCDLDYVPHKARRHKVRVALSNSFGFGGHNATLIVRGWEGDSDHRNVAQEE